MASRTNSGDSGMGTVLLIGAVGLIGWWAYETFFTGAAATSSPAPSSGGAPSSTGTQTGSSSSGTSTSSSGAGSGGSSSGSGSSSSASAGATPAQIATLYTLLQQFVAAGFNNGDTSITYSSGVYSATPDVFNYYLTEFSPSAPSWATTPYGWPPDAGQLFSNRSAVITLSAYWAVVSPTLAQSSGGVSGIFRGLGMLVEASRRWPEMSRNPYGSGEWPAGLPDWWTGGSPCGGGAGRPVQ